MDKSYASTIVIRRKDPYIKQKYLILFCITVGMIS